MALILQSLNILAYENASRILYQERATIPWWVWILLIVIVIVLLYFILRGSQKAAPAIAAVEAVPAPAAEAVTPDDLTVIEGIGPKVSRILIDSGIQTYQQLADADLDEVNRILDRAKLQMMDPSTWGEQARLAAEGDWDGLKEMQAELKGGRV